MKSITRGAGTFWFLLLLLSTQVSASVPTVNPKELSEIASSRYWKLLLHHGQADGLDFYLRSGGKPKNDEEFEAELRADVAEFSDTDSNRKVGPLKQHAQCAFPERYRFLKKELKLKTTDLHCKDFEAWKARLKPKSVTLVFASAHMNNPASMFGHTFLRIDSHPRAGSSTKNDLLDYGANYSASTGNDGGITFALLGLLGGYPGAFSMTPYFEKIHEYQAMEARDLWEYKLALDEEQITRMLAHLWELGTTYFDYYFFNRNCAYHLLALLEVARPEWHLTDQFFYWVIPSDTIRVLARTPGAISSTTFRPSLRRVLQTKFDALSGEEQKKFLRDEKQDSSPELLDTLLEASKLETGGTTLTEHELRVALARAPRQPREIAIATPESTKPTVGHQSSKLALLGGRVAGRDFIGTEIRPAFHDLWDGDAGYLPNSQITLARTQLRYYPSDKRFRVHEAIISEIVSLSRLNKLQSPWSWEAGGGLFSPQDFECKSCNSAKAYAGFGKSVGTEALLAFLLGRVQAEYSGYFKNNVRGGPGLHSGQIVTLPTAVPILGGVLKLGSEQEAYYFPNQEKKLVFSVTGKASIAISTRFELRGSYQNDWGRDGRRQSFSAQGSHYF